MSPEQLFYAPVLAHREQSPPPLLPPSYQRQCHLGSSEGMMQGEQLAHTHTHTNVRARTHRRLQAYTVGYLGARALRRTSSLHLRSVERGVSAFFPVVCITCVTFRPVKRRMGVELLGQRPARRLQPRLAPRSTRWDGRARPCGRGRTDHGWLSGQVLDDRTSEGAAGEQCTVGDPPCVQAAA